MGGQFSLGINIGGNPSYNDGGSVDASGFVTLFDFVPSAQKQGDGDFNHGPGAELGEPHVFFQGNLGQLAQSTQYAEAYGPALAAFEKLSAKKEPVPCKREPYQTKPWHLDDSDGEPLTPDHMKDGQ